VTKLLQRLHDELVRRNYEKGDANRSARVERPFHFIEHNFLAGRRFADLADLNAQARAFCDKVNATHKRHLHASPRELFAAEHAHLRPLPLFVPEVYALHHRLVDVEGSRGVPARACPCASPSEAPQLSFAA